MGIRRTVRQEKRREGFDDFRLRVTFVHAETGKEMTVPGYFALRRDAADRGYRVQAPVHKSAELRRLQAGAAGGRLGAQLLNSGGLEAERML